MSLMTRATKKGKRAKGQEGQKGQKYGLGAKILIKGKKGKKGLFSEENVGSPAVLAQIRTSLGSSADVERTFSKLNKMLAKDRNFDVTNIENYISIYCNISL